MEKKILFAIIGGVIVLLLGIILLSGGAGKPQSVSGVVKNIAFGRAVTEDKKIDGDEVTVFTTNDTDIIAVVDFVNVPAATTVRYEWANTNTSELLLGEDRAVKDPFSGSSITKISKKSLQWGTGDFVLRVLINGTEDYSGKFSVRTPQQISQEQFLNILKNVSIVSEVDLTGKPAVGAKTSFTQDSAKVYASVAYQQAPKDTEFTLKWRYLPDDRTIKTFTKKVEGDGSFAALFEARADSWLASHRFAKGKYTVQVMINNEQIKEINFTVE
ncbi:MAG: hypothetical protein WC045_01590 [Patescibacteria group bacterium]